MSRKTHKRIQNQEKRQDSSVMLQDLPLDTCAQFMKLFKASKKRAHQIDRENLSRIKSFSAFMRRHGDKLLPATICVVIISSVLVFLIKKTIWPSMSVEFITIYTVGVLLLVVAVATVIPIIGIFLNINRMPAPFWRTVSEIIKSDAPKYGLSQNQLEEGYQLARYWTRQRRNAIWGICAAFGIYLTIHSLLFENNNTFRTILEKHVGINWCTQPAIFTCAFAIGGVLMFIFINIPVKWLNHLSFYFKKEDWNE